MCHPPFPCLPFPPGLFFVAGLCVFLLLPSCGARPAARTPRAEEVTFRSSDGCTLHGTLYRPASPMPPGLILAHRKGASRRSWEPFAERAVREGYLCLALDLRGHGQSTLCENAPTSYRDFDTLDWLAALRDLAAAKEAIVAHGADARNLALAGEAVGSSLVMRYALADEDVEATVLISPGLDYEGIELEGSMAHLRKRPVLLVAAEGDTYAASSAATLKARATNFCELRTYAGSAHGTDLLDSSPDALDQVLHWLDVVLAEPGRQRAE